ncbi:hypothetical protein [Rhodohalobacter barkolensis]|uniref:Uncharacterized protein n=1 Tax=Rhodohalobacter barkolensis TaxID=2053187 RepID=A0A2N0VI41_9BACT|nr:hypothetical protein [Rhodohalobacter barkolensis]PKD43857.1 hypothetical protein CWD77_09905 [Rhodohalobacter barkolensis]
MTSERTQKLKLQKIFSIVIIMLGIALLTYMVVVEYEPGAIPLLMIVAGTGWYLITRSRIKSLHR